MRAFGEDSANNQTIENIGSFTFDNEAPIAGIIVPSSGAFYNSLPTISGTATDNVGIATVTISIEDLTTGVCYSTGSGSFGGACPDYFPVAGNCQNAVGNPASCSWSYSNIPWSNEHQYLVLSKAEDLASNVQNTFALGVSSNAFVFDTTLPLVGLSTPPASIPEPPGSFRMSSVSPISGTASVPAPDHLALVQVCVQQLTGGLGDFWNPAVGAFDQTSCDWMAATTANSWVNWSTMTDIPWISGDQYAIIARSEDEAGNFSVPYSTYNIVFDNTPPITAVVLPASGTYVNASGIAQIYGTMQDQTQTGADTGTVTTVDIEINNITNDTCWNGTSFQAPPCPVLGGGAIVPVYQSSWSLNAAYVPPVVDLISGDSYYLTTSGTDNAYPAGNVEAYSSSINSQVVVDTIPPNGVVTSPTNGAVVASLATITGTAQDVGPNPSGVSNASQISVSIGQVSPGNGCWNGTITGGTFTLSGCPIFYPITNSGLGGTYSAGFWSVNAPPLTTKYTYRVWVQVTDNAGNVEPLSEVSSMTFTYDTTAPGIAITAPVGLPAVGGNLNAITTLAGTASDEFGISYASVAFQEADTLMYYSGVTSTFSSTTPVWFNAPVTGTAPNFSWISSTWPAIAPTTGRKYNIYAEAANLSGVVTTPVSITIEWDTTPPLSAPTFPANISYVNNISSITGTAQDPGTSPSGVAGVQTQIESVSQNSCWTGSAFTGTCGLTGAWLSGAVLGVPVGGVYPWTDTTSLPPSNNSGGFANGSQYLVTSRAFDLATNTQTVTTQNSFYFDASSPTAVVQFPLQDKYYNSVPSITGTAQDNLPGDFNVLFPRVRIYDISLAEAWDSLDNKFDLPETSTSAWNVASSSSSTGAPFNWAFNTSGINWQPRDWATGSGYRIDVWVLDDAGNYTVTSTTFGFTNVPPSSLVTFPSPNGVWFDSMSVIDGTALDNYAPITNVSLEMWYSTNGVTNYWETVLPHWTTTPGFVPLNVTGAEGSAIAWNYTGVDFNDPTSNNFSWHGGAGNLPPDGMTFNLITQAVDAAGNVQTIYSTAPFCQVGVVPG